MTTLAVEWLATSDDVPCGPDVHLLALHLKATRDLVVRCLRFHMTHGYLGQRGPEALCMVGECPDVTGGKRILLRGLSRGEGRRLAVLRSHVPINVSGQPDLLLRQSTEMSPGRTQDFWSWSAGLVIAQPMRGPSDLYFWSGRIELPAGCCLGLAVQSSVPAAVRVEVGGLL